MTATNWRVRAYVAGAMLLIAAASAMPWAARAQTPAPSLAQVPQGSPIPRIAPQAAPPAAPPLAPAPLPPAALPAATVAVNSVVVEGASAYPSATLLALAANLTGPATSLKNIEAARRAILLRYRDGGYPFVVVKARVDKGGVLHFAVAEGYIAEIKLAGDIGPAGTLVLRFLEHLTQERPVNNASIEYWLLLAQSIPGVQVQPIVQASEREPGAFTLIAKLSRQQYSGNLAIDNRAFRSTGTGEGLLTLGLNSLTSFGERSEASFFLAGPSGRQIFGQASEEFLLGSHGLAVRLYAGTGDTLPCCDLAAIGYDGKTVVYGAEVSYPVLLSRQQQLHVRGTLDAMDSEAIENGARASGDSLRVLRAAADYVLSDVALGSSMAASNQASVRLSKGLPVLGASSNGRPDGGRLNQNTHFVKINAEASRDQTLATLAGGPRISLFGLLAGQESGDILPSAEEFYLGGMRYTRGFYAGEVTGDRAFAATLELRASFEFSTDLFGAPVDIAPQFYAFYDWGETWQNQATDANHRVRSFGGGVRTGITPNLHWDVEAVHRVTRQVGGGNTSPEAVNALYSRIVAQF